MTDLTSLAGEILRTVRTEGGVTLDVWNGFINVNSGYVVNGDAPCPLLPELVLNPMFYRGPLILSTAITAMIDGSTDHIGIWHDKRHQKIVVDRVYVFYTRIDAMDFGRKHDQRFIYDLNLGTEVVIE